MEVLGEESDWWPPARPYCWEPVVKVKIAELLVSFKSHKLTFLSKPALATQLWASDDAKHFTKSAWFPSVCIELEHKLWGFHNLMVLSDDAETTKKNRRDFSYCTFSSFPFLLSAQLTNFIMTTKNNIIHPISMGLREYAGSCFWWSGCLCEKRINGLYPCMGFCNEVRTIEDWSKIHSLLGTPLSEESISNLDERWSGICKSQPATTPSRPAEYRMPPWLGWEWSRPADGSRAREFTPKRWARSSFSFFTTYETFRRVVALII